MRLRRWIMAFGFAVMITVGFGCATATHFTKLPGPDDFKKPLPQLKQEFSDIIKYEPPRMNITILDMPEAVALTDAWGKPHRTGFSLWMIIPTMWILHPSDYWYWEFEGKKVSALIDRPIAFGYKPHVWHLVIEEKK